MKTTFPKSLLKNENVSDRLEGITCSTYISHKITCPNYKATPTAPKEEAKISIIVKIFEQTLQG